MESFNDSPLNIIEQNDISKKAEVDNQTADVVEEPVAKSLLGKGKSRVIFYLMLNMARAQIFLMKENGSKLATLSQDNFLTDIKVLQVFLAF